MIPRDLEVQPQNLEKWTAAALINRLRSQIKRAEATLAKIGGGGSLKRGWLIGGLHCEFDPTAALYQFHYHLIASDHMIAVLDQMRKQRIYRRQPGDRVRDRIRMSRQPLDNLPAPLSYPWQLFWPARARGDGSDDEIGFSQLHRLKRRIDDPYHTQTLLWLDQQRVEDMTLLMGVRVGAGGFVKTYMNEGEVR